MGAPRPHGVEKREASRGPRHRANRCSDAADRGREARGASRGGAVSRSPTDGQARTPKEDAAPRGHSAAEAYGGAKTEARAQTAAIGSSLSRASRPWTACRHPREACPSSGSLPDVAETPVCDLSEANQEVGKKHRTPPGKSGRLRERASWCAGALYDTASPGSGVRDAGPWLRAPCALLDSKSGVNVARRLSNTKRNQCLLYEDHPFSVDS